MREAGSQDVTDVGSETETIRITESPHPDDSASQCGSVDHTNPRSPVPSETLSTVSAATGTGKYNKQ